MTVIIVASLLSLIVGGAISYLVFRYVLRSKYETILKEAEVEAEVIKKNKLLEVKEKFLNKKSDLEKEVAARNQKIQQAENRLKQREIVIKQRHDQVQKRKHETDAIRKNLENQLAIVDKKQEELDDLKYKKIEKIEE